MINSKAVIAVLGALATLCAASNRTFPDSFTFGSSISAWQVEGAWNESGRTESILDRFLRGKDGNFDRSVEGGNCEIGCDSYHLWERDIEMAEELGLGNFRMSISWSRLLPTGFTNKINQDAVTYYSNFFDGLLAKNITPVVALLFLDTPQNLQDLGGWTNPLMVEWFAEYADLVFSLYADRVTKWLTINEPSIMCDLAYETGRAPGIVEPEVAPFICGKYVLLGHARAYRIYEEKYKPTYNGKISLSQALSWYEPLTSEDEELTDLVREFFIGRYLHPIHLGGWPTALEKHMSELSTKEGYSWSRLPPLSDEEIALIKGTCDFFSFNHYTSRYVRAALDGETVKTTPNSGVKELNAVLVANSSWTYGANPAFAVYPEGMRKLLVWVDQYIGKPGETEILITENGFSTNATHPNDEGRISYIGSILEQILLAIHEDGVNCIGYTYWALMDTIRLYIGTGLLPFRFGLYETDFASPNLTRTPRGSAEYYKGIIKNRSLD